jgi:hypothetical protein
MPHPDGDEDEDYHPKEQYGFGELVFVWQM